MDGYEDWKTLTWQLFTPVCLSYGCTGPWSVKKCLYYWDSKDVECNQIAVYVLCNIEMSKFVCVWHVLYIYGKVTLRLLDEVVDYSTNTSGVFNIKLMVNLMYYAW